MVGDPLVPLGDDGLIRIDYQRSYCLVIAAIGSPGKPALDFWPKCRAMGWSFWHR
jgi:hypothetical protein